MMGKTTTLGNDRLGSGKKQKVYLHGYERSTHDLSHAVRTTMASGTLVPFMSELALPGDTWDIDLNVDVKTHPTIGPLFGSYKVQLDVFQCPWRLFMPTLQMNLLNVGRNMNKVYIPQVELNGRRPNGSSDIDNQHVNPSCIFSYFGIRGLGFPTDNSANYVSRRFNAIPWLMYWEIYKAYYSNKQEGIGAVIHNDLQEVTVELGTGILANASGLPVNIVENGNDTDLYNVLIDNNSSLTWTIATGWQEFDLDRIKVYISGEMLPITELFTVWEWDQETGTLKGTIPPVDGMWRNVGIYTLDRSFTNSNNIEPKIKTFPLVNIDDMRKTFYENIFSSTPRIMDSGEQEPYGLPLYSRVVGGDEPIARSLTSNQEGLALKTYQSDLFNNWLDTEWIDGENGVNAVTAVTVTDGKFTLDELNLSKKVYEMLNRIEVSGGTYYDWIETIYDVKAEQQANNPMYMGGLSKELVFQEVISQAEAGSQPLGTLAGRGVMSGKHKGGKMTIRVNEPSYIIGIVSLTPRVDYSQGNKWDVNLNTMDDLHKPQLDQIGFQDLITDQMGWWDTLVNNDEYGLTYKSAGKQPAWTNYTTNVNRVLGNFAVQSEQMWMVLNRRYENEWDEDKTRIKDLTTYIDPSKFNHIFAYTRRDAQNFWVQIGLGLTARRKMSARQMPNL